MKTENKFRVGDKVFVAGFGWGEYQEEWGEGVTRSLVIFHGMGTYWLHNDLISFTEYEINTNQVIPFEDGDIVYISKSGYIGAFIAIAKNETEFYFKVGRLSEMVYENFKTDGLESLATPEQVQLLFDLLEKNGKRWNPETKQLEDLSEPIIIGAPIDNVTTDILQLALRASGIVVDLKITDRIIDLVELIEIHGEDTNLEHLSSLQDEWKKLKEFNADDNREKAYDKYMEMEIKRMVEPKVGDNAILWNGRKENDAMIGKVTQVEGGTYTTLGHWFENAIKWDGTKEQLDNVRKGNYE